MANADDEFTRLMERLRAGDPEAARELFEGYGREIQIVVRRRLNQRLRSQFDSLDFSQDAWASFFHIPPESYTFETPEKLVAFLSRIARRKVFDAYRQRLGTLKHNRGRLRRLRRPTQDDTDPSNEPAAPQPTPSQVAMAEEKWDRLLHDVPPEVRRALEMLRLGHSHREIAECLGVPTKTIQRVLQNLKRKSP